MSTSKCVRKLEIGIVRPLLFAGWLISAAVTTVHAADEASPPAGYRMVAEDGGGFPGRPPHLQLGAGSRIGEGQVHADKVKADHPARSITSDFTAVVFDYRGLDSQAKYVLRLTFLSDHPNGPRFPKRVVRIKAGSAILAERVELPKDEVVVRQFPLPAETYAEDGSVTLRIEKVEGINAVVSRVELWSDRDAPPADVRLPPVFASHMVLQRDRPIPVWGYADPGTKVGVQIGENRAATQADNRGRWELRLSSMPAGGPYAMTIQGKRRLVLGDILLGDVWICSGQSNMEMSFQQDKFFAEEKLQAANAKMRLFKVPALWSAGPASQMIGAWQRCDATSAAVFSAAGYYFGRELQRELNVPVGLIQAAIGGTPIENWTPGRVGHWYNGMMHPMLPFAIRGAIWYQGESNIESGENYLRQMQELIGGWRRVWQQGQFPVYFVQLAPFRHRDDATKLPIIWEAQRKSLMIPNTGMAVTTDVGEGNLHPPDKRIVGHRLALGALARTYGRKPLVYSGPLFTFYEINGRKMVLHFDHVGGGLVSRNGKPLDWFEIAGKDGKFVTADATTDGQTVSLTSSAVAEPVAARFGWNQLAEPNLVNREGLPASPFRTDPFF